jgi:hypothetical protein
MPVGSEDDDEQRNANTRTTTTSGSATTAGGGIAARRTTTTGALSDPAGEYGGITGTIKPSSFSNVGKALMGLPIDHHSLSSGQNLHTSNTLPAAFCLKRGESIFLDIGCGTGRPVLAMAGLPVKLSIGFDIAPVQVLNSCAGYNVASRRCASTLTAPVVFFQHDLDKYTSFDPVTHAYAFAGFAEFVHNIARVAAGSTTLKALALVVVHTNDTKDCGLYDGEDTDVLYLGTMAMPGGRAYSGYMFPMTEMRKARVRQAMTSMSSASSIKKQVAPAPPPPPHDLTELVRQCTATGEGWKKVMEQEMGKCNRSPPKRASAKRARKMISEVA